VIKYISSALAIICLTLLISCEKEVNINLDSGEAKLVIDGQIETNGYPFVILTKSIGYFSRIDLATLENSFVHNAIVKVSDGARTIQLKEYSIDTGFNGGNKFSFYAIDTGDLVSFSFKGVEDGYYSLSVETENKTFTAYTKIPKVKGVDSVWFRELNDAPVEGSVLMFVRYADPDTIGNYVRYFTKRNSDLFYPGAFNSTFDDQIVNGTIIDSLSLSAGYNKGKEPNQDSIGYFFKGDTVTLKWCAIDKGVYKFFSTLEYATGSIGNPFSSPVNVTSNIKGGALGVWAGYGIQETSRIISK
jgi:hypothetical protein